MKHYEACQRKLSRLAFDEYKAQRATHSKAGRRLSTFRYSPPQWHRDAIEALGRGDEEAVKAAILYRF